LHDENLVLSACQQPGPDVALVDPFVVLAEGCCPFATTDLLALAELVERRRSCPDPASIDK